MLECCRKHGHPPHSSGLPLVFSMCRFHSSASRSQKAPSSDGPPASANTLFSSSGRERQTLCSLSCAVVSETHLTGRKRREIRSILLDKTSNYTSICSRAVTQSRYFVVELAPRHRNEIFVSFICTSYSLTGPAGKLQESY